MSILISTNKKLIRVSQDYSAGDNIGINDYVISSRNWTPDITYTSESAYQRATNYTDTQISALSGEVSAEVSHLSSDIDYISGVALTSHQSLEGYATESFVENVSGDITALIPTNYYPDNNPSGFITGVDLSNYYQKNETSSKQEISAAIANVPQGDPDVNNVVHNYSANGTWLTAHQDISNKLDTTAFSTVSGDFLTTSFGISESATWNNVSETVQTNSAQWSQGGTTYTSPSGTILIDGDTLEGTNSAISVGYEGFVSSYGLRPVGPNDTARYTWDKAVPNTIITLDTWATRNTIYWSANTDLTGEIVLPEAGRTTQSISIPNATAFAAWSDNYFNINGATVSAADIETTVGELAWASALPTYEYDSTNKISAINGSALAGGTDYYETAVTSTQDFVVQQPGVVQSGNGNVRYSKLVSNIYGTNNIEATALGLENLNNAKIYANFSNVTSYGFSYPSIYLSGTLNGSDTYGGWQFSNTSTYTSTLANGIDITAISSRGDVNLVGLGIPDTILGVYFLANANNSTITAKTVPFTASITSPGTTISLTSLYDSIPETSGFVPLSSFNELKQSYDALSSLFATYSGQWLLPNEGV